MPSHRLSPVRRVALCSAAILLAGGFASAQAFSSSHSSDSDAAPATTYSSSADGQPADLVSAPDPAPRPAGGGQYDNRASARGGRWRNHNQWAFEAGGGFNAPTEDSSPYIGWGGNFQVGAGVHLSPVLSILAEYQFFRNSLPSAIVAETGANDGYTHIWSLTLNPVVDLFPKSSNTMYLTGGGGFYRKVTSFTDPQAVEYCTYFYCGIGYQNTVVGHFSSNQGGWSAGAGFAHRFGGMYGEGHTQVFAEARYLWIDTPAVIRQSANGLNPATIGAGTELIPVTFGVRF